MVIVVSCFLHAPTHCEAQQAKMPFSVVDDIALVKFDAPFGGSKPVQVSPDGNYFVVYTDRGRLDLNRPEDSLRFYSSRDVEDFLKHSKESQPPSPVWVITLSTDKEGPIISDCRWL